MKNHMISVIFGDVGLLAPWVTVFFLVKMISHIREKNKIKIVIFGVLTVVALSAGIFLAWYSIQLM